MTHSQIGLAYQTDGSRMQGTCVLASLIIVQMLKAGYAPSMYRVGYFKDQSQTSWAILLINFDSLASLRQKNVLVTSFSMDESVQESLTGNGEHTRARTNMLSTRILALRKKLTMMVLFFKYLC
jgi:hypothetical protein